MKCKLCKKKTTWDESYGKSNFIFCPKCIKRLTLTVKTIRTSDKVDEFTDIAIATGMIFTIGMIKEENRG